MKPGDAGRKKAEFSKTTRANLEESKKKQAETAKGTSKLPQTSGTLSQTPIGERNLQAEDTQIDINRWHGILVDNQGYMDKLYIEIVKVESLDRSTIDKIQKVFESNNDMNVAALKYFEQSMDVFEKAGLDINKLISGSELEKKKEISEAFYVLNEIVQDSRSPGTVSLKDAERLKQKLSNMGTSGKPLFSVI